MEDITYKEIEAASAGIFQRIKEIKIENVLLKVNEDIKLFEEQNSVVKQNKTDCLSRFKRSLELLQREVKDFHIRKSPFPISLEEIDMGLEFMTTFGLDIHKIGSLLKFTRRDQASSEFITSFPDLKMTIPPRTNPMKVFNNKSGSRYAVCVTIGQSFVAIAQALQLFEVRHYSYSQNANATGIEKIKDLIYFLLAVRKMIMSTIQHYQKVGQEICVQLRVFIEHNAETDGLVFAGNSEFVTLPYYVLDYIFDFVPEKLWIFNCCRIDLADSSPNEYNFESNNLLSQTSKVFTCQPGQLAQVYSRFKSNSQEELEDVIMGDQIMKLLKCTDNIAQFVSTVHMNFKFIDQQAQINSNSYDLETSLFFLVQASERIQNYYGVKDLASVQFGIHKDHYYNFISTGRHFGNSFEQSPKKDLRDVKTFPEFEQLAQNFNTSKNNLSKLSLVAFSRSDWFNTPFEEDFKEIKESHVMAKYDFSLIPRGVPQKLYPNFVRYAHKYLIENSHLVKELIAQVDCTPSKGNRTNPFASQVDSPFNTQQPSNRLSNSNVGFHDFISGCEQFSQLNINAEVECEMVLEEALPSTDNESHLGPNVSLAEFSPFEIGYKHFQSKEIFTLLENRFEFSAETFYQRLVERIDLDIYLSADQKRFLFSKFGQLKSNSNYPLNEKNTKVLLKEMWENTQLDGNSVIVVFPDSKRLTALKSQGIKSQPYEGPHLPLYWFMRHIGLRVNKHYYRGNKYDGCHVFAELSADVLDYC